MSRVSSLCEKEYERTFYRWLYTPKWRPLARLLRRLEYQQWLDAMLAEVKREAHLNDIAADMRKART